LFKKKLIFAVNIGVQNTVEASAAQLVKCVLLQTYSHTVVVPIAAQANKSFIK